MNAVLNRFGLTAIALFAAAGVQAQNFPGKPLRIVVPFSAGGPADITTRNISPRLSELLGQSIIERRSKR